METVDKKSIKKFILSQEFELEKIIDYLELNFDETIEGIINALFCLMRKYDSNPPEKDKADSLIELLENLTSIKTSEELKVYLGPIIDFNNKISHLKLKERLLISAPVNRLNNLFNNITNLQLSEINNSKSQYLYYLIFQKRNLYIIEKYLNNSSYILNSRNKEGDDIFAILLKKYLYLEEENQEEISYLYHIILLFLDSKYGKAILKNKEQYLRIIRKSKLEYQEHVIKVLELFDPNFTITLQELEERYGILFDFPNFILTEHNTFQMNNKGRVNYTNQACITIDGIHAECLDDAIYIEKNLNGTYTLYIHITDIPSFVPYHSLTDQEASHRVETIYLRDRNILLYPPRIYNEICSLTPNNNRNVITYIFTLDSNFRLIEDQFQIVPGKIKVAHKMTYEEVDEHLKKPTDNLLDITLYYLAKFAEERKKVTKKKEDYRVYENLARLDTNHESLKIDHSIAANIVHESMILVNYKVAKYFKELSLPYIYRCLKVPSTEFIQEQLNKIQQLDSKIIESKEFLLNLEQNYIEAIYSLTPTYHRGLRLENYSHSTSPGRRYPDSLGQYLIHDFIFNSNIEEENIYAWEYHLKNSIRYFNEKIKNNEIFSSHYNYLSYKKLIKEQRKK